MKAAIFCGSRDWDDEEAVRAAFERLMPDVLIEGDARGADMIAARVAKEHGYMKLDCGPAEIDAPLNGHGVIEAFAPAYSRFPGRAAPVIRNGWMAARLIVYRAALWQVSAVAFHSDIERSRGTADMVEKLNLVRIPVEVIS